MSSLKTFPKIIDVTIPVGTATSAEVDLENFTIVGVYLPATFDGTTIRFQAAPVSGGTFIDVEDAAGANFTLTTSAASKYVPVSNSGLAILSGCRFIKVLTGSTQTTTDTVLQLAVRAI